MACSKHDDGKQPTLQEFYHVDQVITPSDTLPGGSFTLTFSRRLDAAGDVSSNDLVIPDGASFSFDQNHFWVGPYDFHVDKNKEGELLLHNDTLILIARFLGNNLQ